MMIFLQIFFISIILNSVKGASQLQRSEHDFNYKYDGSCQWQRYKCLPIKKAFAKEILDSIPEQVKLERANQFLQENGNKNLKIIKTADMGFGIQFQKDAKKGDMILDMDARKGISERGINFGQFFDNSLTRQHRFLSYFQFQSEENSWESMQNVQIINMLYHFCRFNDTFLKGDLSGITESKSLIFTLTDYEIHLLKEHKSYFNMHNVMEIRVEYFKTYDKMMKMINETLTQEEFTLFFQRDSISIDDYMFMKYILESRSFIGNHRIIFVPCLHYANQNPVVQLNQRFLINDEKMNRIQLESLFDFKYKSQLFIDYNYQDISTYILSGGFFPEKILSFCYKFKILDDILSSIFKLEKNLCLNDYQDIKAITTVAIIVNNTNVFNLTSEEQKTIQNQLQQQEFYNQLSDSNHTQNIQVYAQQLDKFDEEEQEYLSLWKKIVEDMEEQLKTYKSLRNQFQDYKYSRHFKQLDYFNAETLENFFNFIYQHILTCEERIANVIDIDLII